MNRDNINTCSVGVMAYNEAANIKFLIMDLLCQKSNDFSISEIIVVSSGSTDSTQDIVTRLQKENKGIKLLTQEKRLGKASAINLFLNEAKGEFVVLISADTRIKDDVLEKVLTPLLKDNVGMTGGRPMPVNSLDTFMGYGLNLLWQLHHQLALERPKLGEIIAFRNLVKSIPGQTAVDEAYLEYFFTNRGLSLKYLPDAVIYNKGPESIREFLSQRERIFIGHLWLKKKYRYSVSSLDNLLIAKLALKNINLKPRYFIWTIGFIFLEIIARSKATLKLIIFKRNPFIWENIGTSKFLTSHKP